MFSKKFTSEVIDLGNPSFSPLLFWVNLPFWLSSTPLWKFPTICSLHFEKGEDTTLKRKYLGFLKCYFLKSVKKWNSTEFCKEVHVIISRINYFSISVDTLKKEKKVAGENNDLWLADMSARRECQGVGVDWITDMNDVMGITVFRFKYLLR